MTVKLEITRDGQRYEVEVEGYVTSYGSPGRYHGHPDSRYPAEAPEVEIESARLCCCDFPVVLTSAEQREAADKIAEAEREEMSERWADSQAEGWS